MGRDGQNAASRGTQVAEWREESVQRAFYIAALDAKATEIRRDLRRVNQRLRRTLKKHIPQDSSAASSPTRPRQRIIPCQPNPGSTS